MAITYGFYNSLNGDRKYNAFQMSSIFDGVIRDGVFQSIGGYLATKPGTGMQVIVSPGKAWFDHTWTVNDADLPLDISPSDLTLSRYDAVVLETDATKAVRENSIKVVKGTPASAPKKPTLVNEGDVHQHPLAYILVPRGSSSIQVQNIDIMVGKAECPFVTSILESVSIEALLAKWEGEFKAWSDKKENDFQTWFDDLQSQMEGDVATNLQNQINKINQTTATKETKSLYGVPSDGTPDDVFQAINSIGDIKVSTRTDLGDSWLLCNGEIINKKKYPELVKLFPKDGGTMIQTNGIEYYPPEDYEARSRHVLDNYIYFIQDGGYSRKYAYKAVQFPESEVALREFPRQFYYPRMKKIGDKYAVYEANSVDDLMVSDSIDGPWESKKITVDSNTYWSMGESLHYVNGHYIVFMQNRLPNSVPDTDIRAIAYTTDIESGDWKIFKPGAFKNKRMMRAIGFMQGKWVIFGQDFSRNETPIVSVSENADITSFGDTYRNFNLKVTDECVSIKDKIYAANHKMYVMRSPGENMEAISNEITGALSWARTDGKYIFSGTVVLDTENEVVYNMKNAAGSSAEAGCGDGFYLWEGSHLSYISIQEAIVTYLPEVSVPNAYAYIRGK